MVIDMQAKEIMEHAVRALDKKKAQDIKVLDIHNLTILGDYFIIAGGGSSTQVKSLADEVEYQLKQKGVSPIRTEGYHSATWVVIDYGEVLIHIFYKETRDFYALEHVWRDGATVDISRLLEQAAD